MFKNYKNLGFNNPYYFSRNGKTYIFKGFAETTKNYKDNLKIDPVGVIEILNKGYLLGNRTLISGIHRTPWLAKPNEDKTGWCYTPPPEHGKLLLSEEEIAKELFQKICSEIKQYVGERKKIGVLLSGGMDSRMVAGALDFLVKTEELKDLEITGLTWGNRDSRDVIYAKKISERLNWRWKVYQVTAKDFWKNIEETAFHGCEYSPLHLHALPQIRDDKTISDIELILGGSYGDSIGRGEYSSRKIKNLHPISDNIKNVGRFIRSDTYRKKRHEIFDDINQYHSLFPTTKSYIQNEYDQQLHYMRRMLNPCMEILTTNTDFHQVFCDPDVFGFMWSLDITKRNNHVYTLMLKHFYTDLSDIPWARTGKPFGNESSIPDNYNKEHHSYIEIIQKELWPKIEELILSEQIQSLPFLNQEAIKNILNLVKKFPPNHLFYLERIVWLASFSIMIKNYNIEPEDGTLKRSLADKASPILNAYHYFEKSLINKSLTNSHMRRLAGLISGKEV